MEIYEINSVQKIDASEGGKASTEYRPFYSVNHSSNEDEDLRFWYSKRKPSLMRYDSGTEVFLSVVDVLVLRADVPCCWGGTVLEEAVLLLLLPGTVVDDGTRGEG